MPERLPQSGFRLESVVEPDRAIVVRLAEVPVPEPGPKDVVIRVEAAPINPSDIGVMFAAGNVSKAEQGGTPALPLVRLPLSDGAAAAASSRVGEALPIGNEGAGTVVAAGSSEAAQELLGKLVGVSGGGMYSQYRTVRASACLPLPEGTPLTLAAASFINPMTALGMVETMMAEGHQAIVHTAAASNLGQMLNRLCLREEVPLVNIVRSTAQKELLQAAGAQHVCDSSSEDFAAELAEAVRATGATIGFDAIGGGAMADHILKAMETAASEQDGFQAYGSDTHKQVYVYGSLDFGPTTLRRNYGMAWGVGGWLLTPFLQRAGRERIARMRRKVADELTTTFASEFGEQVSLAGALRPEAVAAYGRPSTAAKFLIRPNDQIGAE
jgi:NADPH:quinone reductase